MQQQKWHCVCGDAWNSLCCNALVTFAFCKVIFFWKLRDGIALCVQLWMPGSVGGGSLVEDFSQSHQLCHSDLLPSTHILEPIPGHTIIRNIVQRIQSVILMLLGGGNTVLSFSLVLKLLRSSSLCFQVFCPATLNRVKILTEVYLTDSALFPPTFQKRTCPKKHCPGKSCPTESRI